MALWSHVDVQAGHQRRYERAELTRQLATVRGATVVEVAPFNRLLVPLMWAQRRMLRPGDAVATT
ncbi:MAG: methyltransferase type 11, partial [Myxococcales bacterium]